MAALKPTRVLPEAILVGPPIRPNGTSTAAARYVRLTSTPDCCWLIEPCPLPLKVFALVAWRRHVDLQDPRRDFLASRGFPPHLVGPLVLTEAHINGMPQQSVGRRSHRLTQTDLDHLPPSRRGLAP